MRKNPRGGKSTYVGVHTYTYVRILELLNALNDLVCRCLIAVGVVLLSENHIVRPYVLYLPNMLCMFVPLYVGTHMQDRHTSLACT